LSLSHSVAKKYQAKTKNEGRTAKGTTTVALASVTADPDPVVVIVTVDFFQVVVADTVDPVLVDIGVTSDPVFMVGPPDPPLNFQVSTFASETRTPPEENPRNRNHRSSYKSQQRCCPRKSKIMNQLACK
jgi:hypothetical protein